jgi:hypothetical protein
MSAIPVENGLEPILNREGQVRLCDFDDNHYENDDASGLEDVFDHMGNARKGGLLRLEFVVGASGEPRPVTIYHAPFLRP